MLYRETNDSNNDWKVPQAAHSNRRQSCQRLICIISMVLATTVPSDERHTHTHTYSIHRSPQQKCTHQSTHSHSSSPTRSHSSFGWFLEQTFFVSSKTQSFSIKCGVIVDTTQFICYFRTKRIDAEINKFQTNKIC